MQTSLRRTVTKAVTIALFSLLIASFALWGVGDIFRDTGRGQAVIQVGDQEVGQAEFQRSFQREFNRVRQQIGGQLDMETARQLGLVDQILRQTVTRLLFDQKARDLGLVVSDEQVVERIRQQEAFRTAGQFNRQLFEQTLRQSGLSEARYVELLKSDIDRQHLATAAAGALQVPGAMAEALYRYRNERRIADYLLVRNESFEIQEPDAETLRQYHEQNSGQFMAPAYRSLTVLHLDPQQLMDEVAVGDQELRQAFEANKDRYGSPETRELRQIVLDSEDEAEQARALLSEGRSFEAVAAEVTGRAPADLGQNRRSELLEPLREAAFGAEEGAVTEPVQSPLGWHLVKVDTVNEGQTPSFEAVKDELRADLAMDKAVDSLVDLANTVDDQLASGASIAEAAQQVGFEVRQIDQISRQGNAPDGEPVEDIPQSGEFLQTAFETEQGQQSLLKETDAGGYYVLRVDGITPEQVRPFEQVRDRVLSAWRADQRAQEAQKTAEHIAGRIAEGATLAQFADDRGLSVQTTQPLTRGDNRQAGPVGRALADQLFGIEVGGAVTAGVQDGVAVAQLKDVQAANPSENPDAVDQLRAQARQGLRSDVLAEFANALRNRYDVQVNQQLLDQILNRSS
jgi:peptidyl-prolyl cis-trans isomerase D